MAFQGDSIFWVEVEKIVPNPYQPRREFDEQKLQELSDSVKMYGVLQPLTVTRNEIQREDGTFYTEYELVAGERRLRASKMAGLSQVPVIIREGENNDQEKLELAIIENLQREDLNAVDRAIAFKQLADSFSLSHSQVARKVGRSREYVSNSIRLLGLPEYMLTAIKKGEMTEGHARTLLMLNDKPEEQDVVFRETILKKLSVREVEKIVRKIATDKVRKKIPGEFDTELIEMEKRFMETLGTRVHIQKTDYGGQLTIDYFSVEDLELMLSRMKDDDIRRQTGEGEELDKLIAHTPLTTMREDETLSSKIDEENYWPQNDTVSLVRENIEPVSESIPTPTPTPELVSEPEPISEFVSLPKSEPTPMSDMEPVVTSESMTTPTYTPITTAPTPTANFATEPTPAYVSEAQVSSLPAQAHVPNQIPAPQPVPLITPVEHEQIANHQPDGYLHTPHTPVQQPAPSAPAPTNVWPVANAPVQPTPIQPVAKAEPAKMPPKNEDDSDLYSIRNFSV